MDGQVSDKDLPLTSLCFDVTNHHPQATKCIRWKDAAKLMVELLEQSSHSAMNSMSASQSQSRRILDGAMCQSNPCLLFLPCWSQGELSLINCSFHVPGWVWLSGTLARDQRMKKRETTESLPFFLPHHASQQLHHLLLSSSSHQTCPPGCWVTQLLALVAPLLPLTPKPRAVGPSCCWLLGSFITFWLPSVFITCLSNSLY
jgi:hypothetical protein